MGNRVVMTCPRAILLGLACLIAPLAGATRPTAAAETALEVIHLANEGVLLRCGGRSVVIDGFVAESYAGYGALSPKARQALLAAEAPFERLPLALASHVHRDHFQPALARQVLAAHPKMQLVSSPQVIDALRAEVAEGWESIRGRTLALLPAPGKIETLELADIRVELLHLSHGSGRFEQIQNLGHVIHLGGWKILHVGDAAMVEEHFAAYDLPSREIDLALIPYWYYSSDAGQALVREHLRAPRSIAVHVPPSEVDEVVARLAEAYPDVDVLRGSLERLTIEREPSAKP